MARSIITLLLCVPFAHGSVLFTTIHLADSSTFSTKAFSSLVLTVTNASSLALHAVEPDTITGVQGKRLFASPAQFYSFQLLHVTRVRSSIEAEDERTAAAIIRYSLPHEALLRGMGVMGVDSVDLGEADAGWARWLTTTYLELPPFVAQYLVLGWALTVLGFLTCITCYCRWCMGPREVIRVVQRAVVPTAIVTPTDPPVEAAIPAARVQGTAGAKTPAEPESDSFHRSNANSESQPEHIPIARLREILRKNRSSRERQTSKE